MAEDAGSQTSSSAINTHRNSGTNKELSQSIPALVSPGTNNPIEIIVLG